MNKRLTDLERLKLMTPEERDEYLSALLIIKLMKPQPTREQPTGDNK